MQLFCRLTPTGRHDQKLSVGGVDILILRPSHSVMSGAFLSGYLQSMRMWGNRRAVQAYLIEGKPAPGVPVYCCDHFQGSIEDRLLGTSKAPEIGTLIFKEGAWDVAFRVIQSPQKTEENKQVA